MLFCRALSRLETSMLTLETIDKLCILLARVDLKGNEVDSFNKIVNELSIEKQAALEAQRVGSIVSQIKLTDSEAIGS